MRILTGLIVLCWLPCAFATSSWQNVERIVAIGDVHGAYSRLVALLQATDIIDDNLSWQGGDTHLVSLGDLLDRGPHSRQVMDLLMRLSEEAESSGGYVHVLVGNHELMNLTGDLRDVSAEEYAALDGPSGHRKAFSRQGRYGAWLLEKPFIIQINNSVFTHGGISTALLNMSLAEINQQAHRDLITLLDEAEQLRAQGLLPADSDLIEEAFTATPERQTQLGKPFMQAADSQLLNSTGPMWYRGTASCHELLEAKTLEDALSNWGAQRVVIGHTPTPNREINTRFKQTAYLIDTGMLAKVYQGQARALEITQQAVRAINAEGDSAEITHLPGKDPIDQLQSDGFQMLQEHRGSIDLQMDSGLQARFVKLSKRQANRALAAYALDRMLGLRLVPATVPRNINGKQGILMDWSARPFSEKTRIDQGIGRPNYCANTSDYDLLAVFDALIGQKQRSAENLFYKQPSWALTLTENYKAFGTSQQIPDIARQRTLPVGLAEKLKGLNLTQLKDHLTEYLSNKEIESILKRRDTILTWPQTT